MELIKCVIGLPMGFFIPGYLLGRLLGIRGGDLLAVAFVLSSLLLYQVVFFMALSPLGAEFLTVIAVLSFFSLLLFFVLKKYRLEIFPQKSLAEKPDFFSVIICAIFALLLISRYFFQPMSSPDSVFRWNWMATLLLKRGNFDFYPPSSMEDFFIYSYPDGFPPFVSAIYFWIYASLGKVDTVFTLPVVVGQFILCCFYVYRAAKILNDDKESPSFAVVTLLSSSLFFFSVYLGQETGWTALSAAIILYYGARIAKKDCNFANLAMITAAAAVGALLREYGLIFLVLMALVLFFSGTSKKRIFFALAAGFALSFPFYLRSIFLHHNPFYPLSFLGGILPYNKIYDGIAAEYAGHFGVLNNPLLLVLCFQFLILSAPVQVIVFIAGFAEFAKNKILYIFAAVIIILWIYSTNYTCGGLYYSMRVLSPAIIVISIMAAGIFAKIATRNPNVKRHWKKGAVAVLAFSFIMSSLTPVFPFKISPRLWAYLPFGKIHRIEPMIHKYIENLPAGSVILSDSALYHAELLQNGSGTANLALLWAPDLSFLYNDNIGVDEKIKILKKSGFTHIMKTKESVNNLFFNRFSFFRKYPARCRKIIEGPDSCIYEL